MKFIAGLLCLGLLAVTPAIAGEMDMKSVDHMKMDMRGSAPSSKAFEDSMRKMHAAMMMSYTGNTDVDFVRGMVPHHQGAVDMATVELQYGKDPEIRRLAEDILKTQEREIALMNGWLAKHAQK